MVARTINVVQEEGYWEGIREAARVLDAGGVVVFPTETVYGVGARVDRAEGLRRLGEAKRRPVGKPFTIHIPRRDDADRYVPDLSSHARRLIKKGWPGPLTLVVRTRDPSEAPIAAEVDASAIDAIYHDRTVGLRCPDDPVARDMLGETGGPVVAASANLAGRTPPRTAGKALEGLGELVDLVLDGGAARYDKPSTIVRVNGDGYEVVREGVYDARMLRGLVQVRLLFVCTGNSCRSPMAAGLARQLIAARFGCAPEELAGHNINVSSAGTFAMGGGGPSEHAVAVLQARGIDISSHASRPLTVELINQADHVLTMTASHREAVVTMAPSAAGRTTTLLDDGDIADPIGSGREVYADCADTIETALKKRLSEVQL